MKYISLDFLSTNIRDMVQYLSKILLDPLSKILLDPINF
uniref:Uncharacterized protein n=1 Tax=viral metagenome TaxID=1070528 RepID=A0A6C0AGR5_9ZZZZ